MMKKNSLSLSRGFTLIRTLAQAKNLDKAQPRRGFTLIRTLADAKNLDKVQPYNGFTLIELLVALTVIAVLVALGLNSYQGARKVARDSKRKADLEQIRSALEIYRTDCKTYPLNADMVWGTQLKGTYSTGTFCLTSDIYMEKIPTDPSTNTYYYNRITQNSYLLCASLETGSAVAETGCGSNCVGVCNHKVTNP